MIAQLAGVVKLRWFKIKKQDLFMKRNPAPFVVLALLTAGYVAFVALSSPLLPEHVAIHFGINGHANNWASRSQAIFFSELLTILPLFFGFFALLIKVLPTSAINLPNKDYWLAPERRDQTTSWISGQIAWIGCLNVGFITGLYVLMIETNNTPPAQLPMNLLWPLAGAFVAVTILWLVRFCLHFSKLR
jgi:uncharacterized membrane protein